MYKRILIRAAVLTVATLGAAGLASQASSASGAPDASVSVFPSATEAQVGRSFVYNVLVAPPPTPPTVTSTSGPQWTGIVLFRLALTLSGTIAISETADVTLQLVDTTAGTALPLLTGSGFDGTVLTRSAPRITSRVGAAPATYALEVPILSLRLGHAYAVRVHATDLEQQSTDLDLPFKLLEKWW